MAAAFIQELICFLEYENKKLDIRLTRIKRLLRTVKQYGCKNTDELGRLRAHFTIAKYTINNCIIEIERIIQEGQIR